ncbi:hypothetical protein D3C78_1829250 [compost metagenome]
MPFSPCAVMIRPMPEASTLAMRIPKTLLPVLSAMNAYSEPLALKTMICSTPPSERVTVVTETGIIIGRVMPRRSA